MFYKKLKNFNNKKIGLGNLFFDWKIDFWIKKPEKHKKNYKNCKNANLPMIPRSAAPGRRPISI